MNTNWLAAQGFAGSGDEATAAWLATESATLASTAGCAEYFDPTTKAGHGGQCFSWTAALTLEWLAG